MKPGSNDRAHTAVQFTEEQRFVSGCAFRRDISKFLSQRHQALTSKTKSFQQLLAREVPPRDH